MVCAVCAVNHVRINGTCVACARGSSKSGTLWMVVIMALAYVSVVVALMIRVKPKPVVTATAPTTISLRTAATVLTAISKMRRKSREEPREESLGLKTMASEEATGRATDAVSEKAGNDAGEFEVDALPTFLGRVRVFFGFMQINAALNLVVDVPWPRAFLDFIDFSKIINVDFMSITSPFSPCSFDVSYLDVFYLHMLLLPMILACSALAFFLARCLAFFLARCKSVETTKDPMIHVAIKVINFVVFLLYPGVCTRIFRLFKCREINGHSYLVADFSIQCWDTEHMVAVGIAVLCGVMYVLGIPLGSMRLLYTRKGQLDKAETADLFGSLYLSYERPYWYWETVEMFKKMILAGGLVIVATGSSAQVLIGMLVSLGYLMALIRLEPYEDIVADRSQMCMSLQILLNLLIGLVIKLDEKRGQEAEYDPNAVGIILVFMNVAMVIMGVGSALVSFPLFQSRKLCYLKTKRWCQKITRRCCGKHAVVNGKRVSVTGMIASRREVAIELAITAQLKKENVSKRFRAFQQVTNPAFFNRDEMEVNPLHTKGTAKVIKKEGKIKIRNWKKRSQVMLSTEFYDKARKPAARGLI